MNPDVLGNIAQHLPMFSKGKKSIATYILNNPDQAAFMTAANVGKAVKVSESSVVRFASELGYRGYPEMQKALQEGLMLKLTERKDFSEPTIKSETDDPIKTAIDCEFKDIKKYMDALDSQKIHEGVGLLTHARRIYIYATRSCVCLLQYLHSCFTDLSLDHVVLGGMEPMEALAMASHISPGDVLLAIGEENEPLLATLCTFTSRSGGKILHMGDGKGRSDGDLIFVNLPLQDENGLCNMTVAVTVLHCFVSLLRENIQNIGTNKFKEIQELYYGYKSENV